MFFFFFFCCKSYPMHATWNNSGNCAIGDLQHFQGCDAEKTGEAVTGHEDYGMLATACVLRACGCLCASCYGCASASTYAQEIDKSTEPLALLLCLHYALVHVRCCCCLIASIRPCLPLWHRMPLSSHFKPNSLTPCKRSRRKQRP